MESLDEIIDDLLIEMGVEPEEIEEDNSLDLDSLFD